MKYLITPLIFVIKNILQILLAILLTIIWGVPTLFIVIFYPIGYLLWNFKLKFYEIEIWKSGWYGDSITGSLLWGHDYVEYKTYFHRIWNLNKKSNSKLYNFLNKIR
jgi:hypothetical protein